MADTTVERIFAGKDVLLDHNRGDGKTCWVTFTGYGNHTKGFGQDLFVKRNVPAIYFISTWSHWWQPKECETAAHLAKKLILDQGYEKIIVYSASLGAYGAALLSKFLNADVAILIAPQYTINPKKPPFEGRWAKEAKTLSFTNDDMAASISQTARKYVIFDPISFDRHHADLYNRTPRTTFVPVPFSGHVPGLLLQRIGMLKDLIDDLAGDRFDRRLFRAELRRKRRTSEFYWWEMSKHTEARRPKLALRALQRAVDIAPKDGTLIAHLSAFHKRQGNAADALRFAEMALRVDPKNITALNHLVGTYADAKRFDEAEKVAFLCLEQNPRDAGPLTRLSAIWARQKNFGKAVDFAKRACAADNESVGSLTHLAAIYEQCDRFEDALAACHRGLAKDPQNLRLLIQTVKVLGRLGRIDEALATCGEGERLHPDEAFFKEHRSQLSETAVSLAGPGDKVLAARDGKTKRSATFDEVRAAVESKKRSPEELRVSAFKANGRLIRVQQTKAIAAVAACIVLPMIAYIVLRGETRSAEVVPYSAGGSLRYVVKCTYATMVSEKTVEIGPIVGDPSGLSLTSCPGSAREATAQKAVQ